MAGVLVVGLRTSTIIHFRITLSELVRWFRARGATPTGVALINKCKNPHLRVNNCVIVLACYRCTKQLDVHGQRYFHAIWICVYTNNI